MDDIILTAIATARAFQQHSGALRVVLILDRGDLQEPTMVEVDALHDVEVTEGERVTAVASAEHRAHIPKPLPEIRAIPSTAVEIDLDTGELAAPIGTVDHLAESVLALAQAFGGRTVASAEFPTRDPELPITLAAREGERVVLAAGDAQYEL